MQKKLTLTIDEQVHEGLYRVVGAGRIGEFIERLVRPHVLPHELEEAFADMTRDRRREEEAFDWSEGLIADLNDEKG